MSGICQLVCLLVVLLMVIAQGTSWEELQNGPANQDDDFLDPYPAAVPDAKPKDDGNKEKGNHVVSMTAVDTHPEVKDESRNQDHLRATSDTGNGQEPANAGREADELSEANLDSEFMMGTDGGGYVDLRPGTLDPVPVTHTDTMGENGDEDVQSNGDLNAGRLNVKEVTRTDAESVKVKDIGRSQKKTERPFDMSRVEVYGDTGARGDDIDCTDGRFMNSIDCLMSSPADANLSKEGLKAKQQLFDFMELSRQKRQSETDNNDGSVLDEGSGTGDIFPDSTKVANGIYSLLRRISFNVTRKNADTVEKLEDQLQTVFSLIQGFLQVNVTNVTLVNGTLVAEYAVQLSGLGVSGFGSNDLQVFDGLIAFLTNVTAPAYNSIRIDGQPPLSPLDPDDFAFAVEDLLSDICNTTNPCPDSFARCNSTGFDEGVCLHLCFILELEAPCQHGGSCVLIENTTAVCACTDNWTGDQCQEAVTSDELDEGEIVGVTVGAMLVVIGTVGCCCWWLVCRKGTRNIHMTHYSDDAGGSDRYSNPSSKISTFVIDRPRISTSPFNAFNPGHSTSPYQATVRSKPTLFSDA